MHVNKVHFAIHVDHRRHYAVYPQTLKNTINYDEMVAARIVLEGPDARFGPQMTPCDRLQKLQSILLPHANFAIKKVFLHDIQKEL